MGDPAFHSILIYRSKFPQIIHEIPHVKVESDRVVKFGFSKTQTVSSPPLQESGLRRIFIKTFLNDHLTVKQSSLLFSRTICSFHHSQSKVSSCRFKQFCHKCTRVLCLLHSCGLIIFCHSSRVSKRPDSFHERSTKEPGPFSEFV